MQLHYGFDNLPPFRHAAATVGSFDGVHGGHRTLLRHLAEQAREAAGESIVLTFDPHPRITLGRQEGLRLLSSLEEKAVLLEEAGVDHLIVIPFDRAFSRISSEEFAEEYLRRRVGVENLVVGFNHRFGRNQGGDYRSLAGGHAPFRVTEVAEYDVDSEKVSSTVIRRLIGQGEMAHAARMLAHPYLLIAECNGAGELHLDEPLKLLPPPGDYAVRREGRAATLRIGPDGTLRLLEAAPAAGKILLTFE